MILANKQPKFIHNHFFVALILRLLNLAISDFSPDAMLLEDAALYWTTATSGQTFLDNAYLAIFSQTERMPGYFLFLAAIVGIFSAKISCQFLSFSRLLIL